MRKSYTTYILLHIWVLMAGLLSESFAQQSEIYIPVRPEKKQMDLVKELPSAWIYAGKGSKVEIFLEIESFFNDSLTIRLLPGNWDDVQAFIKENDQYKLRLKSGHFIPDQEKGEKAPIFYEKSMLQRMGMQNQFEIKLAAREKIQLKILADQYTDLPLYPQLKLQIGELSIYNKGLLRYLIQFFFLGVILILFVYHLFIYVGNRDLIYLCYSLYMLSLIVHAIDYSGMNSEFFLSNIPVLRPYVKLLADNGIVIFYLTLLRRMIHLKRYGRYYDQLAHILINMHIVIAFVGCVYFVFSSRYLLFLAMSFATSAAGVVLVLMLLGPIYRSKDKPARYFITGSLFLALGNIINAVLWALGIEQIDIFGIFDRMQFFQFSTLIELLWFSLAIALRTRNMDQERSRMRALDEMKSKLFKYVFYQTRSPMTLIIGPTESLMSSLNEGKKIAKETLRYYLNSIKSNAYRLLEGTDQLLDLTKIDEGKMKIRVREVLFKELLEENLVFAKDIARNKGFAFEVDNQAEDLILYTDSEKLGQILRNLIHRALRDVKVGGQVKLSIRKLSNTCEFEIRNTSRGIPKNYLKNVFDRFYHFESEQVQFRNIFGIRLAISKELSRILKGELKVDSEEDIFTSFTLSLPLGNNHFQAYEIDFSEAETEHKTDILLELDHPVLPEMDQENGPKKDLVIVVEDDVDIGRFIQHELQEDFEVVVFETAHEGFEGCLKLNPTLLITDVSLPDFNGFDLALKLKNENNTEHIPIILISNDQYDRYQLNGYPIGLHDFLTKPFDPGLLKSMVHKLVHQKNLLKEQFLKDFLLENTNKESPDIEKQSRESGLSKEDRLFFERVRKSLGENFEHTDYGVSKLAEDTHYERRQLTRKIKQSFNKTPGELIKEFRMEKAKEMLSQGDRRIKEIASMVGYRDTAGFSKAFKEYAGQSPSNFRDTPENLA